MLLEWRNGSTRLDGEGSFCSAPSNRSAKSNPRSGVRPDLFQTESSRSESHELPRMPGPRLLFFTMPGVEDGLGSLAGDASSQIEGIQIKPVAIVATEHDQTQELALKDNGRQEERNRLEAEARARF